MPRGMSGGKDYLCLFLYRWNAPACRLRIRFGLSTMAGSLRCEANRKQTQGEGASCFWVFDRSFSYKMSETTENTPTTQAPAVPSSSSWKLPDGIEDHIEAGKKKQYQYLSSSLTDSLSWHSDLFGFLSQVYWRLLLGRQLEVLLEWSCSDQGKECEEQALPLEWESQLGLRTNEWWLNTGLNEWYNQDQECRCDIQISFDPALISCSWRRAPLTTTFSFKNRPRRSTQLVPFVLKHFV